MSEVCKLLGVGRHTFQELKDVIPHYMIVKTRKYDRKDVMEWLESNKNGGDS